jgi:D-alanyl-D-alanine carboxypeptidase
MCAPYAEKVFALKKRGFFHSLMLSAAFVASAAPAVAQSIRRGYAAIVMDAETGKILYETPNSDERMIPASTTKLMTAYVTFEALQQGRLSQHNDLIVSKASKNVQSTQLPVSEGQKITVEEALYGMLVASANDAPIILAENVGKIHARPGERPVAAFVRRMNDVAGDIGMDKTHFAAPVGFHQGGHYSSAEDMATLARAIIQKFPEYYPIFNTPVYSFRGQALRSTNPLMNPYDRNKIARKTNQRLPLDIDSAYVGIEGMKTGTLNQTGIYNIVASANRFDKRIIGVVFGAPGGVARSDRMRDLLDAGFETLRNETVDEYTPPIPTEKLLIKAQDILPEKQPLAVPPPEFSPPKKKGLSAFLRKIGL